MALPGSFDVPTAAQALLAFWGSQLGGTFFAPGSSLSVAALAGTLIAATFWLMRGKRKRPIRPRVLIRALFPRHIFRGRSSRADFAYFLFSLLGWGLLAGGAILTYDRVHAATYGGLTNLFGPPPHGALPGASCTVLITVATFIAYEFAYWLDHYLKHKVPLLWHFHMVHHSAETLSLLTNFRVHPVDTFIFYNLVAIIVGASGAALGFVLGAPASPAALNGTNILVLVSAIAITHLQHSHLWVGFGPKWGRRLLGPAHHQIHHSADPIHYDRNFGASLAIWDRLFGTLHVPAERRERLRFGMPDLTFDPHGLKAALIMPFAGAAASVRPALARAARISARLPAPARSPMPPAAR